MKKKAPEVGGMSTAISASSVPWRMHPRLERCAPAHAAQTREFDAGSVAQHGPPDAAELEAHGAWLSVIVRPTPAAAEDPSALLLVTGKGAPLESWLAIIMVHVVFVAAPTAPW